MPSAAFDRDPRPLSTEPPGSGQARDLHARVFRARMDAFPSVRSFIEGVGEAARFGRDDSARLVLLIEELFTNTVLHGHGGDSDAVVHLAFEVAEGRVALAYEDAAPPHDPFATRPPPPERPPIEDRPVGGLGVVLVSGMAERVEYSYAGGRNRIRAVMTRSS